MSELRVPISPAERAPILDLRRERKMSSSAHAYVRGSTTRFYQWLASEHGKSLPAAPTIWIGGDCHVGNLGALADRDGTVCIELRDLDQTVIGSPAHDVVRLALSLAMAVRASALPGVVTARVVEATARGYEVVLESKAAQREFALPATPPQLVRLLREAGKRSRKRLFRERIGSDSHLIPIGRRFWPLTPDERAAVEKLVAGEGIRKLVAGLTSRGDEATLSLVDAAYWVKGCSSLGLWRAAALVEIEDARQSKHGEGELALLDIKEAIAPAAPRADGEKMPEHHGERVVAGASALSPSLGERMVAETVNDKPVFVRELLPQDLKLELEAMSAEEAVEVAQYLASTVAVAHARQLDPAASATWLEVFRRGPAKHLSAPAWLWAAVVDLIALHEGAYLEHCREHALGTSIETAVADTVVSQHVTGD